jgi:hypothetical protein
MGGGLMQLVAYGAQDIYLTGNPQITFFKVVYRRHTNFSMEAIEQTINGSVAASSRVSCTISRNGDLVHKMYAEIDITPSAVAMTEIGAVNSGHNVGFTALKEVELEIGGQRIDKQTSTFLSVWDELTNPEYKAVSGVAGVGTAITSAITSIEQNLQYSPTAYQHMIGGFYGLGAVAHTLRVPLQFWFCRNPGLALPLIALQYHEVKLNVTFEALANFNGLTTTSLDGFRIWCDYIYLDTDERRRFAQVSHEYLIEQVQISTGNTGAAAGTDSTFDLNFNHPVKELIWCARQEANEPTSYISIAQNDSTTNQGSVGAAVVGKGLLKLNGHDRFAARSMNYFTQVQPYQHHTNMPLASRIGVYSFALKPEEHQPSGTCNFSRIDNAQLTLNSGNGSTSGGSTVGWDVFAINYNVLRIMSGMGGLAYSN